MTSAPLELEPQAVYVGLGANLDDPQAHVRRALEELDQLPATRLAARSSLYRSAPVGYTQQPDFINAVAELQTRLPPEELLGELRALELRHRRVRSFANAPRTLDLDILLYGERVIAAADLTVPHARMLERAFVLRPLAEIAPEATIPGHGRVRENLARVMDQQCEKIER